MTPVLVRILATVGRALPVGESHRLVHAVPLLSLLAN